MKKQKNRLNALISAFMLPLFLVCSCSPNGSSSSSIGNETSSEESSVGKHIKGKAIFDEYGENHEKPDKDETIWESDQIKGLYVKRNSKSKGELKYQIIEGDTVLFEVEEQLFLCDYNNDGYDDFAMSFCHQTGVRGDYAFCLYDVHNHKGTGYVNYDQFGYHILSKEEGLFIEKTKWFEADLPRSGGYLLTAEKDRTSIDWADYDFKVVRTKSYIGENVHGLRSSMVSKDFQSVNGTATVSTHWDFELVIQYEYRGIYTGIDSLNNCEIILEESPCYKISDLYKAPDNNSSKIYFVLSFNDVQKDFSIKYKVDGIEGECPVHLDNEARYWPGNRHVVRDVIRHNDFSLDDVTNVRYETYTSNNEKTRVSNVYYFNNSEDIASFYNFLDKPIEDLGSTSSRYNPSYDKITFFMGSKSSEVYIADNKINYFGTYGVAFDVSFKDPYKTGVIFTPNSSSAVYTCDAERFVNNLNLEFYEFAELSAKPESITNPKMYMTFDDKKLYIYDNKTIQIEDKYYEVISERDLSYLFK